MENTKASGGEDKLIIFWNLSGQIIRIIEVPCVVYSLKQINEKHLAFGCGYGDYSVYVYDINSYDKVMSLSGHSSDVVNIEILSNGFLASCSLDGTLAIWDLNSGSVVDRVTPFGNQLYRIVQYAKDKIAVCGNTNAIAFYFINGDGRAEQIKYIKGVFQTNVCESLNVISESIIVANTGQDVKMIDLDKETNFLEMSPKYYPNHINSMVTIQG